MFADTQAQETGKLPGQCSNVPFLPCVYLVKGTANLPSDTGMQRVERTNDLIRESQTGTLPASVYWTRPDFIRST